MRNSHVESIAGRMRRLFGCSEPVWGVHFAECTHGRRISMGHVGGECAGCVPDWIFVAGDAGAVSRTEEFAGILYHGVIGRLYDFFDIQFGNGELASER